MESVNNNTLCCPIDDSQSCDDTKFDGLDKASFLNRHKATYGRVEDNATLGSLNDSRNRCERRSGSRNKVTFGSLYKRILGCSNKATLGSLEKVALDWKRSVGALSPKDDRDTLWVPEGERRRLPQEHLPPLTQPSPRRQRHQQQRKRQEQKQNIYQHQHLMEQVACHYDTDTLDRRQVGHAKHTMINASPVRYMNKSDTKTTRKSSENANIDTRCPNENRVKISKTDGNYNTSHNIDSEDYCRNEHHNELKVSARSGSCGKYQHKRHVDESSRRCRNDNNKEVSTRNESHCKSHRQTDASNGRCRNDNCNDEPPPGNNQRPSDTQNKEDNAISICYTIPEEESESVYDFDGEFDDPPVDDLMTLDLDHLTKEKSLTLDRNQILYEKASRMNGVLPNAYILRHLVCSELRLHGQSLGTKRIGVLCVALVTNVNIKVLEISQDDISVQAMWYICEMFQDNASIEQLLLPDCQMGRAPVKILMAYLTHDDHLTHLSLSGNLLMDDSGVLIAEYIKVTNTMEALDLSYNQFGVMAADALGKALLINGTIHTMSVSWNHWVGKATSAFLKCLEKNKALVNLDVSWNGFDVQTSKALTKGLIANTILNTLDISSCRITGEQLSYIGTALKKNSALKFLIMTNNTFSCDAVYIFLRDLHGFKGELAIKEIDFNEMAVSTATRDVCIQLMLENNLMVLYGPVVGTSEMQSDEEALLRLNPLTILLEFGRILGIDLNTLFEYIDKDGDGTLSREEIKEGLNAFNIPLPDLSLDLLIRQLDRDGDGVISLQELLNYDDIDRRSQIKDILYSREKATQGGETGSTRCCKILNRMMLQQGSDSSEALPLGNFKRNTCKFTNNSQFLKNFKRLGKSTIVNNTKSTITIKKNDGRSTKLPSITKK